MPYFFILLFAFGLSLQAADFVPAKIASRILQGYPQVDENKDSKISIAELKEIQPTLPEKQKTFVDRLLKKLGASQGSPSLSEKEGALLNISYGEHERQKFDLYLADSSKKTPLVFYIHGGGFKGGDKSKVKQKDLVENLLKQGISFASTNYRFYHENEAGLLGCMMDSRRALQTIRYHADKYNIDKNRIILMGGSAGAGTSLWIGLRDEMADSESENPIARESTRVKGIIAMATQATYNFDRWQDVLNSKKVSEAGESSKMYAKPDQALLELGVTHSIKRELDMLEWMSSDDPPIYVYNSQKDSVIDLSNPKHRGPSLHHPLHAKALLERAETVGVAPYIHAQGLSIAPKEEIDILAFIMKYI